MNTTPSGMTRRGALKATIANVGLPALALQLARAAAAAPPDGAFNSSTTKGDRLRRPGFLFLELDCYDLAGAIEFFREVAGFEINRNDGAFVILRSDRGELLLNRRGTAPQGAASPPVQGPRVEIGLVVEDLDQAFAAAQKHPDWKIADRIAHQPWGVRDFRVWSPERYYFRITEGPG